MNAIQALIDQLKALLSNTKRELLYTVAHDSLGTDASPNDQAPDEYGCAETVNAIHKKAFGDEIGGDVSTYRLYYALKARKDFVPVTFPKRGDIIISPTGFGTGYIKNGHTGIMSDGGVIMSNDSATGKFMENYTVYSWTQRWGEEGGYPVLFFRKV